MSYGWRAGCPAVGMTAKAVRSGHWFGTLFFDFKVPITFMTDRLP